MPPNPAQKVPPVAHRVAPGPHSRDVNSCPRESHPGGYYCNYSGCPLLRDSGLLPRGGVCVCVCVCIKLHITAQSGLVILVILCHSH